MTVSLLDHAPISLHSALTPARLKQCVKTAPKPQNSNANGNMENIVEHYAFYYGKKSGLKHVDWCFGCGSEHASLIPEKELVAHSFTCYWQKKKPKSIQAIRVKHKKEIELITSTTKVIQPTTSKTSSGHENDDHPYTHNEPKISLW